MRLRLSPSFSSLSRACVFGGALSACIGGQTGGEEDDRGVGGTPALAEDSACESTRAPIAVDAVSPLGFSAVEVLAQLSGRHSASLLWEPNTAPATVAPEQGQSSITLEISYAGGEARFVEDAASRAGPNGAGGVGASPVPQCQPSRLEIDVIMRVSTLGGALDEQFPGTLEAFGTTRALFRESLRLDALEGTLSVDVPPGYSTFTVDLTGALDGEAFSGSLGGTVSGLVRDGVAAKKAASILYAVWPASGGAPPPQP